MNIVVDSGCDFTEELGNKKQFKVKRVPLTLQIGDRHYVDDESIDIDRYLAEMAASKTTPKTAAPSPELYLEKYKNAGSVFVVTLSSHLSASYNNAVLAKKMYLEEFGDKFIHVFNSLSASVGETLISLKIDEYIKEKVSDSEIVEKVNAFIGGMQSYFILENYDTLVKNGRLNPYVAKIAQMLSIKPICYAVEGRMAMLDKARGYHRAFDKLIAAIEKSAVNFEDRILGISHVKCLNRALEFKEKISARLKFKEIVIVETTGLCSTYADKDGIVVSL
jgi:DegV family protein with EDD domain